MKTSLCLAVALLLFTHGSVRAQTASRAKDTAVPSDVAPAQPKLTRFDIDFPGGTPRELVAAIEKAMGRTINVLIPDHAANARLPSLKMHNVNIEQLFFAFERAGQHLHAVVRGETTQWVESRMGFQSQNISYGDDAIWTFYWNSQELPKICRFYPLDEYLAAGVSVDDITTAVRTGWKMLGEDSAQPSLSFHKETKLLIAVGEIAKLETIDQVLHALATRKSRPTEGAGKPSESDKTKH